MNWCNLEIEDLNRNLGSILNEHLKHSAQWHSYLSTKFLFDGHPDKTRALSVAGALVFGAFDLGKSQFQFVSQKNDLDALEAARRHLVGFKKAINSISVTTRLVQNDKHNRRVRIGQSAGVSLINLEPLEQLHTDINLLTRCIERKSINSKIDWKNAAVAGFAAIVWFKITGKPAPKSIHADAPGPFGRLLQDLLDEIFRTQLPNEQPPSARTAMRAFRNVTSSGGKFLSKW